jgi:16S rRNA (guanine(966)-N(2))-methyltransferase RsmD
MDTLFIDGFGGSGAIGLEELSRGAKQSYICEIDKKSYKILQRNCDSINPSKCVSLFGDTFTKLPILLEQLKHQKSIQNDEIVIYLDPPFDIREGMNDIYEKTFKLVKDINNENVILVTFEHMTELDMPDKLGIFTKFKTKKFGKSSLTYYNV